ncbi:MAG: bifunctional UDP-sugar hydrolase/5'-nucleotidase [Eubacteriales bacterium]|nr:bifunctional UDP-sugar hydrolase/5'-nucleotidase [Eubacteriales bacterium]
MFNMIIDKIKSTRRSKTFALMHRLLIALTLIITLALMLMLTACGSKPHPQEKVTILYTNDVHSFLYNQVTDADGNSKKGLTYSSVAAMKKDLEAAGENVLLVDCGDFLQGSIYGNFNEGETVAELMNLAGYQLATLGNHEFDYGMYRMFERTGSLHFPIVCCNFYSVPDNKPVFPAYKILEAGGVKVAFVGITTPETLTTTTPTYFKDESGENYLYSFYNGEDSAELYECVQKAVDEASKEADYVIGLGHLGVEVASESTRSTEVIKHVTGLDAFIDGHSHTVMPGEIVQDASGNAVVLTQTGCYLGAVGKMELGPEGISTELVTEYDNRDPEVEEAEDAYAEKIENEMGAKVASTKIDFTISDPATGLRMVRNAETNLGDLVADSCYWFFNDNLGLNCDVAISNGGGIRADIPAGDINTINCKTVQTFGNIICLIEVTGQEILDMLEMSAKDIGLTDAEKGTPAEFGGFLQVAGLKFTIDADVEFTAELSSDEVWAAPPTGAYRVKDVNVYDREAGAWKPLDVSKTYSIGGINYILRNSGNGYSMFSDSKLILDYVGEDYIVFLAYIKSFEKGADGYPLVSTKNSPLAKLPGYLLDYENPYGSGRIAAP